MSVIWQIRCTSLVTCEYNQPYSGLTCPADPGYLGRLGKSRMSSSYILSLSTAEALCSCLLSVGVYSSWNSWATNCWMIEVLPTPGAPSTATCTVCTIFIQAHLHLSPVLTSAAISGYCLSIMKSWGTLILTSVTAKQMTFGEKTSVVHKDHRSICLKAH